MTKYRILKWDGIRVRLYERNFGTDYFYWSRAENGNTIMTIVPKDLFEYLLERGVITEAKG